ncbi:MAG: hypothetical protein BWY52_03250 [Chloroflexi bacterium ADurb.Bin325]|nr:MAG: hypothetical protein BWY52_03250 [Chloroflexi bacterium ADurb.Bin325]
MPAERGPFQPDLAVEGRVRRGQRLRQLEARVRRDGVPGQRVPAERGLALRCAELLQHEGDSPARVGVRLEPAHPIYPRAAPRELRQPVGQRIEIHEKVLRGRPVRRFSGREAPRQAVPPVIIEAEGVALIHEDEVAGRVGVLVQPRDEAARVIAEEARIGEVGVQPRNQDHDERGRGQQPQPAAQPRPAGQREAGQQQPAGQRDADVAGGGGGAVADDQIVDEQRQPGPQQGEHSQSAGLAASPR